MPAKIDDCIRKTSELILASRHIVLFTGAGLSTASGLPDYRGPDGVWTRRDKGLGPPSIKVAREKIKPNKGHFAIVELERIGKVQFLISQNVDGFHLDSGFPVKKLAELHGNTNLVTCTSCEKTCTKTEVKWDDNIHGPGYRTSKPVAGQPRCPLCKGRIISSIVNFGDPLPEKALDEAVMHSRKLCDCFIVLGSSLVVNPAASLVQIAKLEARARLVINNMGDTPYDPIADLLVPYPINDFFPAVVSLVKEKLGQP